MTETRDTYAYFFVRDFDCDVKEVTQILGFEPTESHNKNERLASGRTRNASSWKRVSDLPRDTVFLSDHLESLLPILEAHRTEVITAASTFDVGLQCVGHFTNVHPGFPLSAEIIRRIAALNLSVDFDLYCYCEGNDSQGTGDQ